MGGYRPTPHAFILALRSNPTRGVANCFKLQTFNSFEVHGSLGSGPVRLLRTLGSPSPWPGGRLSATGQRAVADEPRS